MGEQSSPPRPEPENTSKRADLPGSPGGPSAISLDSRVTLDSAGSGDATAGTRGHRSIGPYVLIKKLGEGGMGQVWLAEQTAPVKRQVALKLIKGGFHSESMIQRFESERQSLAVMNHPSIAKVFEAGSTDDGQPYFVMEYVDGLSITRYCDSKKLKIRERLEIFIKACEGVQHAHQKAIIHRDLKPSNILVVEVDGRPMPRIIDFGLAKAIPVQADGEPTQFTEAGAFVGTRGFMSPEQTDPNISDVDTRTDVYSLGVVLYVLLTGMLPFDSEAQKKKPVDEILRTLREEDPPSPSSKINSEKQSAASAADSRSTEPQQLAKLLHGDLDCIAMKAVERDRARRYGTPSELAADLQRYLENRPVLAQPASRAYRLKKYVQRHRVAAAVGSSGLALLVAFATAQAVQLRRITRERDRANRITEFMTSMFKVADPSEARGNTVTARELLDKASDNIETGLTSDPELRAQLMDVMGNVYGSLGLYPRAQPLLQRAFDTQRHLLGSKNPETLTSMGHLALVLYYEGHYVEAEKLYREELDLRTRILGRDHPDTLLTLRQLAAAVKQQGRYPEAEKMEREALDLSRRALGAEHSGTLKVINNLALTLQDEGHPAEAEKLYRQDLDVERRVMGPEHLDTIRTMGNLALALDDEERYAEAEKLQTEALDIERRVLGPAHPNALRTNANLAWTLQREGRYPQAEKLEREALDIQTRTLGPEHPDTLRTMSNLAWTLDQEGRHVQAEKLERETLEIQRRARGPEDRDTLDTLFNLGWTLHQEGRYGEAEKLEREVLERRGRAFGPEHLDTLAAMGNLALTLQQEGQVAGAEKLFREMLSVERRVVGPDYPQTLETISDLAAVLQKERRYAEAEGLLREMLAAQRRVLAADSPETAGSVYHLGCLAALQGRGDEAISLLQEAVDHGLPVQIDMAMEKDADLRLLHGDPRFAALISHAKGRAAAQKPN
jgi:eukaryotic-like serine/threonine-protein kinase